MNWHLCQLEKGYKFGFDLVMFWSCFGVTLVSIWSQFCFGLDLNNSTIYMLTCFGFGEPLEFGLVVVSDRFQIGFCSNLDLDW